MGFVAIVDTLSKQLLKIEEIPIHEDFDGVDREGDEVPPQTGNYDPTVTGRWYRDDVNSIDISQEDGPSFTLDGNLLRWQKFKLRIG
jgi:primary-amine oxidase